MLNKKNLTRFDTNLFLYYVTYICILFHRFIFYYPIINTTLVRYNLARLNGYGKSLGRSINLKIIYYFHDSIKARFKTNGGKN